MNGYIKRSLLPAQKTVFLCAQTLNFNVTFVIAFRYLNVTNIYGMDMVGLVASRGLQVT